MLFLACLVLMASLATSTPQVGVSPASGRAGTAFTYAGRGFTAGFGATSRLQRPDGLHFQPKRIAVRADGTFEEEIHSGEFEPGTYTVWAVDDYTGASSPPATFEVEPAPDDQP